MNVSRRRFLKAVGALAASIGGVGRVSAETEGSVAPAKPQGKPSFMIFGPQSEGWIDMSGFTDTKDAGYTLTLTYADTITYADTSTWSVPLHVAPDLVQRLHTYDADGNGTFEHVYLPLVDNGK